MVYVRKLRCVILPRAPGRDQFAKNNQVLYMYAMRMTASAIKTRRDGIAVLYSRAVVDVGHVEDLEEELCVCVVSKGC